MSPNPRRRLAAQALTLTLACAPLAAAAAAPPDVAARAGCAACHQVDKKLVGPSYREVAARYKGRKDAEALLADKVRKGSTGVWGPVPMPPSDKGRIGDADLKAVIAWILKTP